MSVQTRRFLILLSVFAIVCIAAGGLWLLREAQISRRMAESRELGLAAHAERKYNDEMLRALSYAARDKSDGEVILALAIARRSVRMENHRHIISSISFAQAAAESMPGDPRPLELLLELYGYTGFIGEIIETADKLLVMNPTHRAAMHGKIRALRAKGEIDAAIETANQLAAAHPDDVSSHLFMLDLMRLQGGAISDRMAYVDALVERHPQDPDYLLLQARIAGSAGEHEKATQIVRRVAEMTLTSPATLTEAVRLMDLLRLSEEAVAMLARQSANPEMADAAALLVAERGWKAGFLDDGVQALAKLVADPSTAPDGALGLAALLQQMGIADRFPGDPEEALRARTTPEATTWTSLLDGRAAMQRGELDVARPMIDSVLESPFIPDLALYSRGQLELARAEPVRAAATFEEAVRIELRWLELRMLLIATLADLGQLDKAVLEAQRAAAMFPRRLEPYNALAHVTTRLIESGRASPQQIDTTLQLLDRLAEENVDELSVLILRARVLNASGRKPEAGDVIAAAIRLGPPSSPDALVELRNVAKEVNRPDLLAQLDEMAADAPSSPALTLDRALASARDGRITEGQSLLRESLAAAAPQDKLAYQRALATFFDEIGDPEGIALRDRLAQENPANLALQIDVLRSERAWSDHAIIGGALDRIKTLAGAESIVWRLGESRRLLTFERTQANAASAAGLLNDILRTEPGNLQALLLLGDANIALDDPASALALFSRALDAAPNESGLYPRVIRMLQESGSTIDAERRLRDFAKLSDISLEMRRQRAQLLVFQAMWPEAEADLRIIAQQGGERDRLALAEFFAARGRAAEATPIYQGIIDNPSADSGALLAAAEYFAERGDVAKANTTIQRVRAALPEVNGELIFAGFQERRGKFEEAEQLFRDLAESSNDATVWGELSAFYLRRNDLEAAQGAVTSGLEVDPANETLTTLNRLLAEATGRGGSDAIGTWGLDPAAAELLQVQSEKPEDPQQATPYLDRLRAITRKYPTYYNAWAALVSDAIELGDFELAAASAQSAARALPSEPRAARLAVEALSQTGMLTEAIAMARIWRDRSLRDPFEAEIALARLEAQAGRAAEALALLTANRERMLANSGSQIDALSLYASLLASSARLDDARSLLTIDGLTPDAKAQVFLAIGRGLLPNPSAARTWLNTAADSMNLADPSHTLALAQIWFDLAGSRGGGADDFRRVIEIASSVASDPDRRIAAAGLLATAYDQTGRFDEAEESYRLVLDADPRQPIILNNLAYLMLKRDKGPVSEEPVRLAESAVEIARAHNLPTAIQASIMDTLGAATLRAGRPADAGKVFRDALNLQPDDPELVAGLAQSLVAEDDPAKREEISTLVARFDRLARTRIVTPTATERMQSVRSHLGAP